MGYSALVKKQVRSAFSLVGDLAVNITLSQKNPASFNFATGDIATTATTQSVIRAIFTNKGRSKDVANTIIGELMIITEDVDDLTIYDSAVINGVTWNFVPPYDNDDYVTKIKVTKEG